MTEDKINDQIRIKVSNKYIYYGVVIPTPMGEWFHPFKAVHRDRSKYTPHQGLRERLRRRKCTKTS